MSGFDPCLYIKVVESQCVLVLVYVDDVLVIGSSHEMIARTRDDLKTRFEMTDSGKCTFALGIELVDGADGSVTMCQRRYEDDILKRFGMDNCKAVDMSSRLVLSDAATKITAPFLEAIGALMHLTTATRPGLRISIKWRTLKKITGLRSSVSYAIYKAPRRMKSATSRVARSTFVDIQTQTGLVISATASRLQPTRSCYWVCQ